MADIKPFRAFRPAKGLEDKIAALPYDVYNREEAKVIVENNPLSFLKIDRAETNFPDTVSTYDEKVYEKASELLQEMIQQKQFVQDEAECYYIYGLEMEGRRQTGIVACASIYDYENGIIMKHENTRADKELDRIHHIDTCNAQTGPIFLAYRQRKELKEVVDKVTATTPINDFVSEDGIRHSVWIISDAKDMVTVQESFAKMNQIYIADGHHRCASAVKVGEQRKQAGVVQESDYFLSVLFPDEELKIYDYNRVIKDLNGKTWKEIMTNLEKYFIIEESAVAVKPDMKSSFGMYGENQWYRLVLKDEFKVSDSVEGLDVSYLQKYVLDEIFGIKDPKTDKRIDFVGGIRGLQELEKRVHTDCKIAFSMYPTSIDELFAVADDQKLMPPKSTWFEPKLRSGLFIHRI